MIRLNDKIGESFHAQFNTMDELSEKVKKLEEHLTQTGDSAGLLIVKNIEGDLRILAKQLYYSITLVEKEL